MIPHHACQGGHLPPTSQNRSRTGPSGAKPPLWLLSPALPLRVSAVYLGGTDRLPGALCRVRWVGCLPLARWAAAIPVLPLTEVSGSKTRSQGVAADPPRFPQRIGPKRPVRPDGAPPLRGSPVGDWSLRRGQRRAPGGPPARQVRHLGITATARRARTDCPGRRLARNRRPAGCSDRKEGAVYARSRGPARSAATASGAITGKRAMNWAMVP